MGSPGPRHGSSGLWPLPEAGGPWAHSLPTPLSRPRLALLLFFSLCSDSRYLTSGVLDTHPSNSTDFFAGQCRAQGVSLFQVAGTHLPVTLRPTSEGKNGLRGGTPHKGPPPGKRTFPTYCSSSEWGLWGHPQLFTQTIMSKFALTLPLGLFHSPSFHVVL